MLPFILIAVAFGLFYLSDVLSKSVDKQTTQGDNKSAWASFISSGILGIVGALLLCVAGLMIAKG